MLATRWRFEIDPLWLGTEHYAVHSVTYVHKWSISHDTAISIVLKQSHQQSLPIFRWWAWRWVRILYPYSVLSLFFRTQRSPCERNRSRCRPSCLRDGRWFEQVCFRCYWYPDWATHDLSTLSFQWYRSTPDEQVALSNDPLVSKAWISFSWPCAPKRWHQAAVLVRSISCKPLKLLVSPPSGSGYIPRRICSLDPHCFSHWSSLLTWFVARPTLSLIVSESGSACAG